MEFRYFDGASWQSSWNSESQGRLPVAVEMRYELKIEEPAKKNVPAGDDDTELVDAREPLALDGCDGARERAERDSDGWTMRRLWTKAKMWRHRIIAAWSFSSRRIRKDLQYQMHVSSSANANRYRPTVTPSHAYPSCRAPQSATPRFRDCRGDRRDPADHAGSVRFLELDASRESSGTCPRGPVTDGVRGGVRARVLGGRAGVAGQPAASRRRTGRCGRSLWRTARRRGSRHA